MKKMSTYLFAVMAVANVGVALLVSGTIRFMVRTYQDFGSLEHLPAVSRQLIAAPWWPYVFVVIGIAGFITRDGAQNHSGPRDGRAYLCHRHVGAVRTACSRVAPDDNLTRTARRER